MDTNYSMIVPEGYEYRRCVCKYYPDEEKYLGEVIEWGPDGDEGSKWMKKYLKRKDVIFTTGLYKLEGD